MMVVVKIMVMMMTMMMMTMMMVMMMIATTAMSSPFACTSLKKAVDMHSAKGNEA